MQQTGRLDRKQYLLELALYLYCQDLHSSFYIGNMVWFDNTQNNLICSVNNQYLFNS